MNTKLIVGAIILLPILAHLGYAVVNSPIANYYVTVDQYVDGSAASPARVGGPVIPGSIQWDTTTRTMHFQIAGDSAKLNVAYRGAAPSSFRDGTTVIVEGAGGPGSEFDATSLLVKCPHEYLPTN